MKSSGSVYVAVVAAALVGYFSYQWWFNPNRAIKQRLGELAAVASVPADEPDLDRLSRPAWVPRGRRSIPATAWRPPSRRGRRPLGA